MIAPFVYRLNLHRLCLIWLLFVSSPIANLQSSPSAVVLLQGVCYITDTQRDGLLAELEADVTN